MSISHQQTYNVTANSTQGSLGGSIGEVGASELVNASTVPASSTNLLVTIAFVVANVQSFVLLASTDLTIKTNSSSSPANTLNLKAGMPWVWSKSAGYYSNPFTTDVTAFYVTNSTASTNLSWRILTS